MAQSALDQLAPSLDDLAPDLTKRKKSALDELAPSLDDLAPPIAPQSNKSLLQLMAEPGNEAEVGNRARSAIFGPLNPLVQAGHKVADWVRGYETPAPEAPGAAPDINEILKGFVTGPLKGYKEFAGAAPDAAAALAEHPVEAGKGLLAGLIESLSSSSPADIAGAAAGLRTKGAGALRTVGGDLLKGKLKPEGIINRPTPERAFNRAYKDATQNLKDTLPTTMSGQEMPTADMIVRESKGPGITPIRQGLMSRLVRPTGEVIDRKPGVVGTPRMNVQDELRTGIQQALAELQKEPIATTGKAAYESTFGVPSPEELAMSKLQSRRDPNGGPTTGRSPAIPDVLDQRDFSHRVVPRTTAEAAMGDPAPKPNAWTGGEGAMGFAMDAGRKAASYERNRARGVSSEVESNAGLAKSVRKMQAERKANLDEAAAATVMKATGSKAKPVSIVERSAALAKTVEDSLKADGKPFAPPAEVPREAQQAASLEILRTQAEQAATGAKGIRAAVEQNPTHPDAAGALRQAERLEQQAAQTRLQMRAKEAVAAEPPKAPTATPVSAPEPVEVPRLNFKPAAETAPSAKERKVGASAAAKQQKFDNSLQIAKEQIRNIDSIEKAAQVRDAHLKNARLQKNELKAKAYGELAKMASDKLNQLVKGHTKAITPELAAASPVVQDVKVQRFDIQGRPLPDTEVPKPAAALAPRSRSAKDLPTLPGETTLEARARGQKGPLELTPEQAQVKAAYDPDQKYESLKTGPGERPPTTGPQGQVLERGPEADLPPGNQVNIKQMTDADYEIVKLAEQTGSGLPPEGVDPVMHASMHVLGMQTGANYKARGILDPRAVEALRQYYGAEKAGKIIGITRERVQQVADGPRRRRPMSAIISEMNDRFEWLMNDEAGFMRNEAAIAAAGGVAGGALGAMYGGEDLKDAVAWAVAGSLIGTAAGYRVARGPKAWSEIRARIEQGVESDTANLLFGPAMVKTTLGSIMGVASGLWEKLGTSPNKKGVRDAMRYISRGEAANDFYKVLKMPAEKLPRTGIYTQEMIKRTGLKMGPISKGLQKLNTSVLRVYIAGDLVGTKALMKAGFSRAEAARQMMVGEPTTWMAQTALKVLEGNLLIRLLAKFPRVRLGSLERGLEYTPFLNQMVNIRNKRSKFGLPFKPQEGLTRAQLRRRGQFGGVMMALGTAYGYYMDPSLSHAGLAASAAGPAFIPAAAAIQFGKSMRKKDVPDSLVQALYNVASQIPQIGEEDIRLSRVKQRLVPGASVYRALQNAGLIDEDK